MILVDSSVWIDFLRRRVTPEVSRLEQFILTQRLGMGDLVLTEILQGIVAERDFEDALRIFSRFRTVPIVGEAVALEAARNYRRLRAKGITIRKTIDTLIATRCIMDGHALLFSDRDFDPFVEHLGLVSAIKV